MSVGFVSWGGQKVPPSSPGGRRLKELRYLEESLLPLSSVYSGGEIGFLLTLEVPGEQPFLLSS